MGEIKTRPKLHAADDALTKITEEEAAELLQVEVKTLRNYVYSGRITTDMYVKNFNGRRFYYREKLVGAA
jgi:predicted site-specific integrase-resolvase